MITLTILQCLREKIHKYIDYCKKNHFEILLLTLLLQNKNAAFNIFAQQIILIFQYFLEIER